jgi:hypothetical protein
MVCHSQRRVTIGELVECDQQSAGVVALVESEGVEDRAQAVQDDHRGVEVAQLARPLGADGRDPSTQQCPRTRGADEPG